MIAVAELTPVEYVGAGGKCRHCEAWIELRTDPTGQRGDAWAERDGWHDDRDFQCGWNEDGRHEPVMEVATCGACGRSWNDALITSRTPAPSARCPFEYEHDPTCGVCGAVLREPQMDCPRIYDAPEHLAFEESEA